MQQFCRLYLTSLLIKLYKFQILKDLVYLKILFSKFLFLIRFYKHIKCHLDKKIKLELFKNLNFYF